MYILIWQSIILHFKQIDLSKISTLVAFAKEDTTNTYSDINFSIFPNFQAQTICGTSGVVVKGMIRYLTASGIRHAFSTHGNHSKESLRGQIGITDADFEFIPEILNSFDSCEKGINNRKGNEAVLFKKTINNKIYHVVMSVQHEKYENKLVFNTMYIKKS